MNDANPYRKAAPEPPEDLPEPTEVLDKPVCVRCRWYQPDKLSTALKNFDMCHRQIGVSPVTGRPLLTDVFCKHKNANSKCQDFEGKRGETTCRRHAAIPSWHRRARNWLSGPDDDGKVPNVVKAWFVFFGLLMVLCVLVGAVTGCTSADPDTHTSDAGLTCGNPPSPRCVKAATDCLEWCVGQIPCGGKRLPTRQCMAALVEAGDPCAIASKTLREYAECTGVEG